MNNVKFSDDVIAKIAQTLQIAILSGTDIVDNLRTMRLVVNGDELVCDPDFLETFEQNIQNMMNEVSQESLSDEV